MSWAILDDDDEKAERYAGFWNLSHKTTMYGDASDLVAFRLMPIEKCLRKPVEADWSFQVVSQEDRVVAFRDRSFGNIISWSWDFGDGTSSTERHPTHRYEQAGEFIVTLHVEGPEGKARRAKVWDTAVGGQNGRWSSREHARWRSLAWLRIELTEDEQRIGQGERESHPDACVRRRRWALWLLH